MRKPFVKPVVMLMSVDEEPLLTGSRGDVRFDVTTEDKDWEGIEFEF